MHTTTDQLERLTNVFNTWVVRVNSSENSTLQVSDFERLKIELQNYILRVNNSPNQVEAEDLEEDLMEICRGFCLSEFVPSNFSGDDLYNFILTEMMIRYVFLRGAYHSLQQMIKLRTEMLIREYLEEFKPATNFGDLL